jgi:hypothetical protein
MANKTQNNIDPFDMPLTRRDFENYMTKMIVKTVFGLMLLYIGISLAIMAGGSETNFIANEFLKAGIASISIMMIITMAVGLVLAFLGLMLFISGIAPSSGNKRRRTTNGSVQSSHSK